MAVSSALVVPKERDGIAAQKVQKREDCRGIGQRYLVWGGRRFPICNNVPESGGGRKKLRSLRRTQMMVEKFFAFINRLVLTVLSEILMWRVAAGNQLEHTPWPQNRNQVFEKVWI
jgi:hypothetical protein